jgi:hypothetical protein
MYLACGVELAHSDPKQGVCLIANNGVDTLAKEKSVDGASQTNQAQNLYPKAFRHFGEGNHKGKIVITLEHNNKT